jgi:hypothetical protein
MVESKINQDKVRQNPLLDQVINVMYDLIQQLHKIEDITQHNRLKIQEPSLFGLRDKQTYEERGVDIRVTPPAKTRELRGQIGQAAVAAVYLAGGPELEYVSTIKGPIVVCEDRVRKRYSIATFARDKETKQRVQLKLNLSPYYKVYGYLDYSIEEEIDEYRVDEREEL